MVAGATPPVAFSARTAPADQEWNMTEVFDLDAIAAEAAKEPMRFTYRGREWSLPHLRDMDWRVVQAADAGELAGLRECFKRGFGDQWEAWDELPQPTSVITALFRRWLGHSGMQPGESPASGSSSEITEQQPRPASEPSTASSSATSSPVA